MTEKNGVETYKKSDLGYLRDYNTKKVLRILRDRGTVSRAAMAETAQLDRKTITNITQELLNLGYIIPVAKQSAGGGRPRELLSLRGDFCRVIGLDIGGTHISGVLMDFSGKVLARHKIEIDDGTDTDTQIMLCNCIVDRLLQRAGLTIRDISEIGIAFPGFYDTGKDTFGLSENFPNWRNVHPKKVFGDKYGIPVCIDDCTRLMALAELWYGNVNSRNFLVFDLGYGIGCAIILNGKMYTGSGRKAGEIGHTVVEVNGPECTCGKHGCIESLASGWALAKQAEQVLINDTVLQKLCLGKKRIRVEDILLASQLGSDRCRELLSAAGKYLAVGISNAMTLMNPEKIIIGGGMINDNGILWDSIIKHVKLSAIPEIFNDTVIEQSTLGEYASATGAAAYCLQPFFE